MLELLFGYWLGKRAGKKQVNQEAEPEMTSYNDFQIESWSSYAQDTRSFEQLLKEARENYANKNNK
jgi:hypothetical protein